MEIESGAVVLRPGVSLEECKAALQEGFGIREGRREKGCAVLWDTFDWRLWFAGRVLLFEDGEWRLSWRDGEGEPLLTEGLGNGESRRAEEFESETLREMVKPILGVRAAVPKVRIEWSVETLDLLDPLRKTVCRMGLVEWRLEGQEAAVRAAVLRPLRGYDTEAAQAASIIGGMGDEGVADPLEELLSRSGDVPEQFSVKLPIQVTEQTASREALGAMASATLTLARRFEAGIREDIDSEFLHDYRVCLRKVRSILSLLQGVYPEHLRIQLKDRLGDIARRTNRLRDGDVYLLERPSFEGMLPGELRPGLAAYFDDLNTARHEAQKDVSAYLESAEYNEAISTVLAIVRGDTEVDDSVDSATPVGELVRRAIAKRYRKITKLARNFSDQTPDPEVHGLRIQCKKLRYLLEFSKGLIPDAPREQAETALRKLQNTLGTFNDCSVQRETVLHHWQAVGRRARHPDLGLAIGGLAAVLFEQQKRERLKIGDRLATFCSKEMRTLFRETFGEPSRGVPDISTPDVQPRIANAL